MRPKLDGLSGADPETRKAIYQGMSLRLTFDPERNAVGITACTQVRVGGPIRSIPYQRPLAACPWS
jgi:hypothetical protein